MFVPHVLPVLGGQRHLRRIGLVQHQLLLRQRLQELADLIVISLRQRLQDLRVEGPEPADEVPHLH